MKKSIAAAAVAAFLIASCQKDDSTSASAANTAGLGSWTVGSNRYYVNNSSYSNDLFFVYDTAGNGLSFGFDTVIQAVTSGNYTVVGGAATTTSRQVTVSAFDQTTGANTYYATGATPTVAAVTVANGRISAIALPATTAAKRSGTDSVTITAAVEPF